MDEEKYKEAWQYSHQRSLMLEEVLQDTLRELQELGLADRLEERWRAGEQGLEKHNIEPLQSLQWRDIESAPKDGKPFLMGWPDYETELAMWDCGTNQIVRSVWQRPEPFGSEHIPDPLDPSNAKWLPLPTPKDE